VIDPDKASRQFSASALPGTFSAEEILSFDIDFATDR
jgi:hypothetical protein